MNLNKNILKIIRKIGTRLWVFFESDPRSNPLWGDTCILYATVIKNLINLDRNEFGNVLDVGCYRSPLTTIVKELGFNVEGLDILPTPAAYNGLNYIQGDFLSVEFDKVYDVVIMCYTIQHIGLGGRFKSCSIDEGDVNAIDKVKQILRSEGILVLCVPYGIEKVIPPWHRVYNKDSKLFKYLEDDFKIIYEEYYKNSSDNVWTKCKEIDAKNIDPSEDNYALGSFVLQRADQGESNK